MQARLVWAYVFALGACGGTRAAVQRAAARELSCPTSEVRVVYLEGDHATVEACRHQGAGLTREDGKWSVNETFSTTDRVVEPEAEPPADASATP